MPLSFWDRAILSRTGGQGIIDADNEETRRAKMNDIYAKQLEGIDINTPEGQAELIKREFADAATHKEAMDMLDNSIRYRNQQNQFQTTFNNLSAYEKAQMIEKQRQFDLGRNNWAPQDLQKAEEGLRKEYTARVLPFVAATNAYQAAKSVNMNAQAGTDTLASVILFNNAINPGNQVTGDEAATTLNSMGILGGWMAKLKSADEKPLSEEDRKQLQHTLDSVMKAKIAEAQKTQREYAALAQGDPTRNIPAFDPLRIVGQPIPNFEDPVFDKKLQQPGAAQTKFKLPPNWKVISQ